MQDKAKAKKLEEEAKKLKNEEDSLFTNEIEGGENVVENPILPADSFKPVDHSVESSETPLDEQKN